jgi:hypothetical protein
MGDVPVGVGGGGRTTLAAMADGAPEFLEPVLIVLRMVGEWLWISAVTRIFHRKMAGGAAIDAIQLGQENLPDPDGDTFRRGFLWRRRRPAHFFLDEFMLDCFPLAVFVLVAGKHNQATDEQAEKSEPRVKLAEGGVHVSVPA